MSCFTALVRIVSLFIILDQRFVAAIERPSDDGPQCCRKFPWKNVKPDESNQCRSPIVILREYMDVDNASTVTFVNYHKTISKYDVEVITGLPLRTTPIAIFVDPRQNLHAILRTPGKMDGVYNLDFIYLHVRCSDHIFHDIPESSVLAETQFVHHDKKYGSLEEAMRRDNGIYIYSFTLRQPHLAVYSDVIRIYRDLISLPRDERKGRERWRDLLPLETPSYVYQYEGSLVSPPCRQSVIWNVDAGKGYPAENYDGDRRSDSRDESMEPRSINPLGCKSCDLPNCRKPQTPSNNVRVQRIRLIVAPKSDTSTKIVKIIVALIFVIALIVGISITVILKYLMMTAILITVAVIVLAIFGFIW